MALPLLNGSVVKIWHGTRGHDYVVVCIDRNAKKIGLLKHTTINYDGSIHGAVTGVRKWIPYEELGTQKIVPRIARVVGVRQIDSTQLANFFSEIGVTNVAAVGHVHNVVTAIDTANDARQFAML
jgi:hypothetical protein